MWQYVVCLARLGLAAFSSSLSRSEKVFFLEAPPGADVFTNDTAHEGIRKYSKTYIPYEKDLSR